MPRTANTVFFPTCRAYSLRAPVNDAELRAGRHEARDRLRPGSAQLARSASPLRSVSIFSGATNKTASAAPKVSLCLMTSSPNLLYMRSDRRLAFQDHVGVPSQSKGSSVIPVLLLLTREEPPRMSIARVSGATHVCRRGSPAVRVSDAKQVRVSVVGNQDEHRLLTLAEVQGKTTPAEVARLGRSGPLTTREPCRGGLDGCNRSPGRLDRSGPTALGPDLFCPFNLE